MAAPVAADPAARWSRLHHGIDPATVPLLRGWLRAMWAIAHPLVRLRVPPTAITLAGVVLAVAAAWAAGPAVAVALVLVLGSVLCDGLDGAVAVLADRATCAGARADAVADRLSELAFAAVLWRCGAPAWLALGAAATALGVDATRRVRHRPARLTAAERPTWTVCAALACLCAALGTAAWPAIVCAGVWIALGLIAVAQLVSDRL